MNIWFQLAATLAVLFVAIPLFGGMLKIKSTVQIAIGIGIASLIALTIGCLHWIWQ